jgi:hypothetical protein
MSNEQKLAEALRYYASGSFDGYGQPNGAVAMDALASYDSQPRTVLEPHATFEPVPQEAVAQELFTAEEVHSYCARARIEERLELGKMVQALLMACDEGRPRGAVRLAARDALAQYEAHVSRAPALPKLRPLTKEQRDDIAQRVVRYPFLSPMDIVDEVERLHGIGLADRGQG